MSIAQWMLLTISINARQIKRRRVEGIKDVLRLDAV